MCRASCTAVCRSGSGSLGRVCQGCARRKASAPGQVLKRISLLLLRPGAKLFQAQGLGAVSGRAGGGMDHEGKVTGSQRPPRRVRCKSLTAPPPQATPSTVPFLAVLPKHGVLGLISVELLDVAKAGLGLDARLLQELKLLPYFIMALHGFINAEPALGLWLGAAPQRGSQGKCLYFLGPP